MLHFAVKALFAPQPDCRRGLATGLSRSDPRGSVLPPRARPGGGFGCAILTQQARADASWWLKAADAARAGTAAAGCHISIPTFCAGADDDAGQIWPAGLAER